ncbi:hypothetical protein JL722_12045 [Aureococcus anophagefferens]|nr:hypothetical protein JL722_12045 [Aureococcus anophagefferens]
MAPQDIVKAQRDRYLYVLSLLVGQKAEAELLEKKTMTGVLHTATPFSDMPHRMVLKGAAEKGTVASPASTVVKGPAQPKGGKKWDQFEANERLFGASTGYDENVYTTKLDDSAFTPAQKAEAARIAAEIENATTSNIHLAEERGQEISTDMDEEDRFGPPAPAPSTLKLNPEAKAFQFNVGAAEWTPSFAAAPPPPPPAPYGVDPYGNPYAVPYGGFALDPYGNPVPYAQPGLPYGFTPPPQFMAPPARPCTAAAAATRRPTAARARRPARGGRGGGGGGEGKGRRQPGGGGGRRGGGGAERRAPAPGGAPAAAPSRAPRPPKLRESSPVPRGGPF